MCVLRGSADEIGDRAAHLAEAEEGDSDLSTRRGNGTLRRLTNETGDTGHGVLHAATDRAAARPRPSSDSGVRIDAGTDVAAAEKGVEADFRDRNGPSRLLSLPVHRAGSSTWALGRNAPGCCGVGGPVP